jgi:hypothetical protein
VKKHETEDLVSTWTQLSSGEAELRKQFSSWDDVEIKHTLDLVSKDPQGRTRLLPAIKVLLGGFDEPVNCDQQDVEYVAIVLRSLMRHADDPTYGGNVRSAVNYYRDCDDSSRSKIACCLLKMLESQDLREDANTIIAGAALFSGWREDNGSKGTRVLGQKLPGEHLNPVRALRKQRKTIQK